MKPPFVLARCLAPVSLLLAVAALAALAASGCAGASRADNKASNEDPVHRFPTASTRLNNIQVIGTHNSFKQGIEPALYDRLHAVTTKIEHVDYSHLPLSDQLNLGVKALEIDIYHDPDGGRYARPLGMGLLRQAGVEPQPYDRAGELAKPGFKVIHDADFDFRSNRLSFEATLAELRDWSIGHPWHAPVIITMNLKHGRGDRPESAVPGPFDGPALDALDAAVIAGLGRERLLTPDDVRAGAAGTLEHAVLTRGWPLFDQLRGKFLFVLDEGPEIRDPYVAGHASLQGRVYFVLAEPGTPEAAFLIINDPQKDEARIRELVAKGYMVRTRADADTQEARAGSYERFEAAKRSGAQVISTDYPIPDRRIHPTYRVRFDDSGFLRANPVTAPPGAR